MEDYKFEKRKSKKYFTLSLTKRFMVSVYTLGKKGTIVFLSLITLFFLTGLACILSGVALNSDDVVKAVNNPLTIFGLVDMVTTFFIVGASAISSNYGRKIFKKELQNEVSDSDEFKYESTTALNNDN